MGAVAEMGEKGRMKTRKVTEVMLVSVRLCYDLRGDVSTRTQNVQCCGGGRMRVVTAYQEV